MKPKFFSASIQRIIMRGSVRSLFLGPALALLVCGPLAGRAMASTAYGSINNFDTVNDTGGECHGFEIELEDINCADITYTYDWNHYGTSKLSEDTSVAAHPKTTVRWASGKHPDGTWSAYTAIPSGPIAATDGHQFTDPSVNFGGEHFGVGYTTPPTAIRYYWLVDDGVGNLVRGPAVQVATPVFVYYPPVQNVPAQVVAAIQPPPPPAAPPKEFGDPLWVKEIRTTSHNSNKVELRELVSGDPNDPDAPDWRNGEPDEVETEWQLMQTEFNQADGGVNGRLEGAPEELPGGDEVVTRRYEFYQYTGPLDAETGEAMADSVGPDNIHGVSTTKGDGTIVDYTDVAIVGDYIGAQMAAIAAEAKVGLIDHLQDAEVGAPYPDRRVVVAGNSPFTSSSSGALPDGMSFDPTSGVLSGTPNETGEFQFSITAEDHVAPPTTKSYILRVAEAGVELPPAYVLATSSEPDVAGTTSGDGSYGVDSNATLTSTAVEGYAFVNWTENGTLVSTNETEMVLMNVNHTLVAHFVSTNAQYAIGATSSPTQGGTITGEGTYSDGTSVTLTATPTQGFLFANWTENGAVVSADAGYTFTATAARDLVANFTIDSSQVGQWIITTGSSPLAGGSTAGGGVFNNGANVTVSATANAGYMFKRWTESNNNVSSSANYLFSATNNRSLIAKFALAYTVTTSSDPTTGGTTDGAGLFEDGDSVNLNATANQGYRFANWIENGTNVSSSASYRLKANPDRSFTARFSLIIPGSDIVPATNGDRVIEWPSATQLPGWTVQSSTNLSDWVACESEVEDDGVTKQIHMRMDTAKRFYRMIHE